MLTIRLAVRDWDYFTPLALGDVRPQGFTLAIDRVGTLADDLGHSAEYDAGEVSFSRYAQGRAKGESSLAGLPHFLMRGFRQRCIITTAESPLTDVAHLAGKKIGLTGWQDSGNSWTRAILREAGVGIPDAHWYVGRLTGRHPIVDRLGGFGHPGLIEAMPGETPMIDALNSGMLDAVFTPFMPEGFFSAGSGLRQLQPDFRQAEIDYFRRTGYVPGMHLLAVKSTVAREYPWLPQALSEVIDESARVWQQKREKYADTTPWLLDEIRQTLQVLPANWNANGLAANERMITDFGRELFEQGITARCLTPAELFPPTATGAR